MNVDLESHLVGDTMNCLSLAAKSILEFLLQQREILQDQNEGKQTKRITCLLL